MWIHLRNEEKEAELNLNFTLFFSVKGMDYKNILKQIIEFYNCSTEEVDDWFKAAFDDFEAVKHDPHMSAYRNKLDKSILQKNYEYFKKTYLPKEKTEKTKIDIILKKINDYKVPKNKPAGKVVVQQDDNTVVMSDGSLALIYNNMDDIFVEEQFGNLNNIDYAKKIVSTLVDNSKKGNYLGTIKFIDIKNISITGYVKYEGYIFDMKPLVKLLDKKETIEVSFNREFSRSSCALILTQRNFVESTTIAILAVNTKINPITDDDIIYDLESIVNP